MDYCKIESRPDLPTSDQIAAELAEAGRPVLVAFSGGKDAIATAIHLRRHAVEMIPYHMVLIPGLTLVEETLERWGQWFGRRIIRVPHPSFWRMLAGNVYQPPQRAAELLAADMPQYDYAELLGALRDDYATDDTWAADGVRAADSIIRRANFATNGVWRHGQHKVSPVWDWRISHVRAAIADEGVELPPDYELFKRSFDGIDKRFLAPLAQHRPDDYRTILEWFPLAEMELMR
jgi:3'-phosphoadenosine 5'-phosphosulfate sulfotransferase (PAPS reductase)/FAD synthetase